MLGTSIVQNSQHALQHEQIMQLNYPRILFDSKYLLLFFAVILFWISIFSVMFWINLFM